MHNKNVYFLKQNICSVYNTPTTIVNMTAARQRKTSERERPLMEATLRIIGRTGPDGVTHRAVAAEAGNAVAAAPQHFPPPPSAGRAPLRLSLRATVAPLSP